MNKRRPIREEAAFGDARTEANAKKSIAAFLDSVEQKNDQAKLTYLQNRLSAVTNNLVKLPTNPETGEFTAAAARTAIDLLSPEFFEKFFGELKQAYPDQINFTPPPPPSEAPVKTTPAAPPQPATEAKKHKFLRLLKEAIRYELKKSMRK